MKKSWIYKQSYITVDQIKRKSQIKELFKKVDVMKKNVETHNVYEPLKGMTVAILFYQPSTRTFSSFEAAARRLGAYTIAIHGMTQYSSVAKGESLEDTIKSIHQTTGADAVVIRHPENNSSEVAASISNVPIINGGSGTKEHPTQALLDLYTIYNHHKKMDGLNVAMVGDLLYGRTIKSLAKVLTVTGRKNKFIFVSPKELMAPRKYVKDLSKKVKISETDNLSKVLPKADVVYMTRVQKEWFEKAGKLDEYERLKGKFILTRHMVNTMKKKAMIMHPLPRVGEIMYEVDDDKRAKYFPQMRSGLYVRMALLEAILKG
ncbi:MAG: aspartate carbamoyltransferase [Patescibacteria group bacterium]|nr:aspartate carbamoyltransferase [Patescibacteria group bacterium]